MCEMQNMRFPYSSKVPLSFTQSVITSYIVTQLSLNHIYKYGWHCTSTTEHRILWLHETTTMTDAASPPPPPRIAYIRTVQTPNAERETIKRLLEGFVRQKPPDAPMHQPTHRFLFGASNASDSHILDILSSSIPEDPIYSRFRHVERSDLELRISSSRAGTPHGKALLKRCKTATISALVSGEDDDECDEIMLMECDYMIDSWTTTYPATWFWESVRAGIPQDTLLNNPAHDMSQYDASKRRLARRYNNYSERQSCCFRGNGGWRCAGCGGKCKRGRCKVKMVEERDVLCYNRLPKEGSREWVGFTAEDVVRRYRLQKAVDGVVEERMARSIDTFSGD